MDFSHRIPFPKGASFLNIFSTTENTMLYRDLLSSNVKKISVALTRFAKIALTLSEFEQYALFNIVRKRVIDNSPKIRKECLILLEQLSNTSLSIHIIPYLLLLTHDDNQNIKSDATKTLGITSRNVGGLRNCKEQLVAAIGAMGAKAFSKIKKEDPDKLISNSRMACCALMAATQILSSMGKDMQRREIVQCLQFLSAATKALEEFMYCPNEEEKKSLFFTTKLRCCLYRLYQETSNIERCPCISCETIILEHDEQCFKFLQPLVTIKFKSNDWPLLLNCPQLLDKFITEFIDNVTEDDCAKALSLPLSTTSLNKLVNHLHKIGHDEVDLESLRNDPKTWKDLPPELLEKVISGAKLVDPKVVPIYGSKMPPIAEIEFISESQLDDIATAIAVKTKPEEIPIVIQKWPNAVISVIRKWKNPLTQWWCPEFVSKLESFVNESVETVARCVPDQQRSLFRAKVADFILQRFEENQKVPPEFWEYATITDELCAFIIENNVVVSAPGELKQKIYTHIYETIVSTRDECDAGDIIGLIAMQSQTMLVDFPDSYEFLSHFFNIVPIESVPEEIELRFLTDYFKYKYPEVELDVLLGQFMPSKLDPSVESFTKKISQEKRIMLLKQSLEQKSIALAVVLILTSPTRISLDCNDDLVPFLVTAKSTVSARWNSNFSRYCKNLDYQNDFKGFQLMYYAARNPIEDYNEITALLMKKPTPLNFHLTLQALSISEMDIQTKNEFFIQALHAIDALTVLVPETVEIMSGLFVDAGSLEIDELIQFCEVFLPLLSSHFANQFLDCIKIAMPYYVKAHMEEWGLLRSTLAQGPAGGVSCFDAEISHYFSLTTVDLFKEFPTAAAKWFAGLPFIVKEEAKATLRPICQEMARAVIEAADTVEAEGLTVETKPGEILCTNDAFDDVFTLRIVVPAAYPLEPLVFDVSTIGKEKKTQDTRDEVRREAIRSGRVEGVISTWNARVSAALRSEEPCPICLSLLDGHGNLPKARCSVCHKSCHVSCIELWLKRALKRHCPWCRAPWKRQKSSSHIV